MKKNILKFSSTLFCIVTSSLTLSSCLRQMDHYLSVVPTDTYYKSTLHYVLDTAVGGFTSEWLVIRTSENIEDEDRDVIYIEYSTMDNDETNPNIEITLIFVEKQVFSLQEDRWVPHTGSFGDKWSDIYGSMSNPSSYVYEMTMDINYRHFPTDLKKTTSEYIEYDFGKYNEVFRISNNIYHVLLYYSFDYQETSIRKAATLSLGKPSDTIPYLSTIELK